jgi:hypothetical protein
LIWNKKWRAANPEKLRKHRVTEKYGISGAEFDALVEKQQGCCAICDEEASPLCVDHDHVTKEVRGLLCSSCNKGIGFLRDNPARLWRAAEYLEVRGG